MIIIIIHKKAYNVNLYNIREYYRQKASGKRTLGIEVYGGIINTNYGIFHIYF
jgi:hypothetical protein